MPACLFYNGNQSSHKVVSPFCAFGFIDLNQSSNQSTSSQSPFLEHAEFKRNRHPKITVQYVYTFHKEGVWCLGKGGAKGDVKFQISIFIFFSPGFFHQKAKLKHVSFMSEWNSIDGVSKLISIFFITPSWKYRSDQNLSLFPFLSRSLSRLSHTLTLPPHSSFLFSSTNKNRNRNKK